MPLPTSDFRNPVCLEMKTIRSNAAAAAAAAATNSNNNNNISNNNGGRGLVDGVLLRGVASSSYDMGSVDSSDTYASCNTHPSHSQGDLTADGCWEMVLDSNLYVNPLEGSPVDGSPPAALQPPLAPSALPVKKSASSDKALRSLGASPLDEAFKGFGAPERERGSRGSLNDAPLPKHRKTRFQQGLKPRTRFGDEEGRGGSAGSRRPSFMPGARSLASATRIINQHLFGLHSLASRASGKNGSKSSLSVDSIDSRASPTPDTHRRSKSILKKSDASYSMSRNGRGGGGGSGGSCGGGGGAGSDDPETEKLISSDNSASSGMGAAGAGGCGCMGGAGDAGSGSGSDYSPSKLPLSPPATPAAAHRLPLQPPRAIGPKSGTKPHALPIKFVGLDGGGGGGTGGRSSSGLKSPLVLLDDLLGGGEKHARDEAAVENRNKERLECSSAGGGGGGDGDGGPADGGCCLDSPLYICPPPPAEEHSPTEETKLLAAGATPARHHCHDFPKS
ncbi:period circadian protein-like isoform X2 [Schistocerca serialis cubense]|uniref:period circadian protein-like isoform X2 n=1 Tax=Schistocerca serialis cubense TaxID=2023355 RepID=UPI00214EDDE7|nr:period circadian protein-like isoform X2 [Schistocerca serialis cubense]